MLRRLALACGVAVLLLAAQTPTPADWLQGAATGKTTVVDLTWPLAPGSPAWPGDEHPFSTKVAATPGKDGYFARTFSMPEHFGTHLDAPAHFPGGKLTVDQIPVSRFFAPAVVIDVRAEVVRNADYRLGTAPIAQWESAHGRIPTGAFVILRTGWDARWPDQVRYRNADAKGVMHFPGYSVEAARLLLTRGVVGLGIDTLSIDYGPSPDFAVHKIDMPAGIYHLENLAHTGQLPASGAFLIVAPIKLEGGSGGPCRVFALLPR